MARAELHAGNVNSEALMDKLVREASIQARGHRLPSVQRCQVPVCDSMLGNFLRVGTRHSMAQRDIRVQHSGTKEPPQATPSQAAGSGTREPRDPMLCTSNSVKSCISRVLGSNPPGGNPTREDPKRKHSTRMQSQKEALHQEAIHQEAVRQDAIPKGSNPPGCNPTREDPCAHCQWPDHHSTTLTCNPSGSSPPGCNPKRKQSTRMQSNEGKSLRALSVAGPSQHHTD